MTNLQSHILIFSALASSLHMESQTNQTQMPKRTVIIQQYTITSNGVTDTVDCMPLLIDTTGNVTVATNKKISATQYDAFTSQQLSNGVTTWVNSYSSPTNQKAFVTATCRDNTGRTFVTGGVRTSAVNGLDMFLVGYDAAGNQFMSATPYNGPNSTTDVGTAICVDNLGYVYITGASDGSFANITDYATIAYNANSGAQLWVSRYNYNNVMDIPTAISYEANSIYVTGASGTTLTNYEVATVRYRAGASGGSQTSAYRTPNTGAGFNKPLGMVTDGSGNMYIAGTMFNGISNNYDLQVQKLDTSLASVWVQNYDGYGYDDAAAGIALDGHNNVIVTGALTRSNGIQELIVLKYDNNGNHLHRYSAQSPNMETQGIRIKTGSNDDIFIGGQYSTGSNKDVAVLILDSTCAKVGEKVFNGSYGLEDKLMDLAISPDNIYLSVRSANGTTDDNLVITYHYKDFMCKPKADTLSHSYFVANAVLATFHKSSLRMTAINNRNLLYGRLRDFVADSTCDKISAALSRDPRKPVDARNLTARKIVSQIETDTVSEGRMGNTVAMPLFYAGLLIELPAGLDEHFAVSAMATVQGDVFRVQLDNMFELEWVPNDTHYAADQSSLHPTAAFPNAHINCEPAWDRTKGEAFLKVGVYDSGCMMYHQDLAPIPYAHDYSTSSYSVTDIVGHGACVASIIGAHSNNGVGVTGIAGGNNGVGGVSLYNMKLGDSNLIPWHVMKQAFIDGASGTNVSGGLGLHIINCSFGLHNASDDDLLESVNYVNGNGVAFICSRGNKQAGDPFTIGAPNIPATLKPNITMNVGASGTNGEYHVRNANGTKFTSMDSLNVDFVAPGAYDNVYACTTILGSNPPWAAPNVTAVNDYTTFAGTSSSAPHVSGVAALMMSKRNQSFSAWDNIVHEDCEAILKLSATDLAVTSAPYNEQAGYDENTGWGRINADAAVQGVESNYRIRHIDPSHYASSVTTNTTLVYANLTLGWNSQATNLPSSGLYLVDVIEVQKNYTYSFPTETLVASWPLYGPSTGYVNSGISSAIDFSEPRNVEIISASLTGAITKTYVYQLKQNVQTGAVLNNTYVPAHPSTINSAFTLYTLSDTPLGIQSPAPEVSYFNLYPNPSNGNFTLGFHSKKEAAGRIRVTDIMGKTVYEQDQRVASGLNRYNLTFSGLVKGIYFISLIVEGNKDLVKKLIIE